MSASASGRAVLTVATAALALFAAAATAAETVWDRLRDGGYTVLLRHATTVAGIGDPSGFKLTECATQRNLSDAGREEARRIGEKFRAEKISVREVFSSRWCRCLDTARLAFDRVTPAPFLDSFFQEPGKRRAQTAATQERIAAFSGPGNQVMVTHQVNITALTGAAPAQGEAFVVRAARDGGVELVAKIPPP